MRRLLAVLFTLAAFTGCSFSLGSDLKVSTAELEKQVSSSLEKTVGQKPDSVTCPDELKGEVGEKVRCTLTSGTTTYGLTATVTAVEGKDVKFDIKVDDQPQ